MFRTLPALCIWLLLTAASVGFAQDLDQGSSLPSWVVPVLRLVSATHVEPTTGIVLSESGLVLIPENFASMGDEIIVLDGGTDIIRNGRPARIEKKFTAAGIQVISVQGLSRRGVSIAARPIQDGSQIVLAAFPPAELIAEGLPPLNIPASVVVFSENGNPSISGETQLPNVTGPLLDSCGDLAGFSVADDVQSMEVSPSTRYTWRTSILQIFEALQITPRESNCAGDELEILEEPAPAIEDDLTEQPGVIEPEPSLEEEPAKEPAREEDPEAAEPPPAPDEELLEIDLLPPFEDDSMEVPEPEEETRSGGWLWLIVALVSFALGLFLHRVRQTRLEETTKGTEDAVMKTSIAAPKESEEDGDTAALSSLDSLLVIKGVLSDGTPFEDSCAVSERAINIVIGRGDTDLRIDSGAVSRQHASLNGARSELTLSDLGSSNGTSINGVPCLEGEILYVEPADIIVLGDARFSIEIRPRRPAGSETG